MTFAQEQAQAMFDLLKEHGELATCEVRLRKTYPAGSCNAEDAWRDFGLWQERHEAAIRAIVKNPNASTTQSFPKGRW